MKNVCQDSRWFLKVQITHIHEYSEVKWTKWGIIGAEKTADKDVRKIKSIIKETFMLVLESSTNIMRNLFFVDENKSQIKATSARENSRFAAFLSRVFIGFFFHSTL